MLTSEHLKELLHYDPETGVFTWMVARGPRAAGQQAGTALREGYVQIGIGKKYHKAHRIAWLYMTGGWPKMIDHIDGDGLNNRWDNLRECTMSQNLGNQKRKSSNRSGFKGVFPQAGKWRAKIFVRGVPTNLGYFSTPEEAHIAYMEAAKTHFGDFARLE